MPILDAALAFAITMLLVATVVTQVVYAVQRFSSLRSDLFAEMLRDFYENELRGVVSREMNRLASEVDGVVTAGIEGAAKELEKKDLAPPGVDLEKLTGLATTELVERLKRSAFGAETLRGLGDRAEAVFTALGERYDTVGEKYTAAFRSHSRRWSTGVALVIALAFNIDSFFLAGTFLGDGAARRAVIAQGELVLGGYEALADEMRKGERATVTAEELDRVIRETRSRVAVLDLDGLPVGWDYFPYANLRGVETLDSRRLHDGGDVGGWLFGVVLTAFFAGLGAPFWYDTVTGLARAVQRDSAKD
ncbi:MAG: hypothetical protein AAGF23_10685 [Acidobacteriota bacterium]